MTLKKITNWFAALLIAVGMLASGAAAKASAPTENNFSIGGAPTGIAFSSDGSTAYIADCSNSKLKVVDVASSHVTHEVAVGNCPMGVALSPDGHTAYLPNYATSDLSVVDLATNSVTATVSLGHSPFSIAISPDGAKLVIPDSAGGVYVVDTASNTIASHVVVGSAPVYAAITSDGLHAFVSDANVSSIYEINLQNYTVANTFSIASVMNYGLTLNADDSLLYISEYGGGAGIHEVVMNTATGAVESSIEVCSGPEYSTFAPDPTKLLVACSDGNLDVVDTATGSVQSATATRPGSRFVAITGDGATGFVSNYDDHSVSTVHFDPALVATDVTENNSKGLANTGAGLNATPIAIGAALIALGLILIARRKAE
jgi:LPXTG-motif cell wall-anchored protein